VTDVDTAGQWDQAYDAGDTTRSWFQEHAGQSLSMLDAAGTTQQDSVIDVGGGASTFVDDLLDRGHHDVTVLDISATGLDAARNRLGHAAVDVTWVVADLLRWQPPRSYRVWHDRAVFHFLTADDQRQQYLQVLNAATATGSVAVFGTFAPDGPQRCSGLPVARYSSIELAGELGDPWRLTFEAREQHRTPGGAIQPFTWAVFRR
jgi:SAM-dependent methyltransferase